MVFVIHWHESAVDIHVFPIPIPPPTSHSTGSLWVFPVHQARALVSCIQPGLVICFTLDNIHVLMLFSWNTPPSPSPTESKIFPSFLISFPIICFLYFSLMFSLPYKFLEYLCHEALGLLKIIQSSLSLLPRHSETITNVPFGEMPGILTWKSREVGGGLRKTKSETLPHLRDKLNTLGKCWSSESKVVSFSTHFPINNLTKPFPSW